MLLAGLRVGGACGNSSVKGRVGLVARGVPAFEARGGGMKMLSGVRDYERTL